MFDKLAWQRTKRRATKGVCLKRDKAYRDRRHAQVLQKLGGRCANATCAWINADGTRGCTDERCLQVDHVFGDGYEERHHKKMARTTFYNRVLADTEGRYQLLCANCNWIKRALNNEIGHHNS